MTLHNTTRTLDNHWPSCSCSYSQNQMIYFHYFLQAANFSHNFVQRYPLQRTFSTTIMEAGGSSTSSYSTALYVATLFLGNSIILPNQYGCNMERLAFNAKRIEVDYSAVWVIPAFNLSNEAIKAIFDDEDVKFHWLVNGISWYKRWKSYLWASSSNSLCKDSELHHFGNSQWWNNTQKGIPYLLILAVKNF